MNIIYNIIIIVFIFISCDKVALDNPDSEDTVLPIVNVTYPANQSIVKNNVAVTVYAFDNIAIEKVSIFLNDSLLVEVTSQTSQIHMTEENIYTYQWNTLLYEEDNHYNIRATVKDSAGNYNHSESIQVQIDNHDNIKPSGLFLTPSTGQILNGNVEILIHAEDNDMVDFLTLFINGDSVKTFENTPESDLYYQYFWNTLEAEEDNINTIHGHVVDISGNYNIIGPINITVNNQDAPDILAPQGTIITPPAGSMVSGVVNIEINAFDNIGVHYVEYIIDGISTSTDSVQPYIYSWNTSNTAEDSDHTININIYDTSNNMTSLYPIMVHVNNIPEPDLTPPTIVIYEPASDQTVSGTVSFLTIATDNDSIDRVEFYHDYTMAHIANSYPYSYDWNTLQEIDNSQHVWFAKAFDVSGNETQTMPMTIFIDNIDDIPPYGSITNPYAGQTVSGIITIQASAVDNIGISSIEFYIDGILEYSDSEDPYLYEWNTANATEDQEHILAIIVEDLEGNTYENNIVVNVDNDPYSEDDTTPPFASILTPISGQTVSDTVTVSGFATDNYSISEVRYYIDDELVLTATDTPYTYFWDTLVLEDSTQHIIQMIAEDQAGNIATAQPVLVITEHSE